MSVTNSAPVGGCWMQWYYYLFEESLGGSGSMANCRAIEDLENDVGIMMESMASGCPGVHCLALGTS